MNEKDFIINISINFTNIVTAENKAKAIEIVKTQFLEEYNIILQDNEIKIKNN